MRASARDYACLCKRLVVLSLGLLLIVPCHPLFAHFKLNLNIRIVHIDHRDDGLDVYMRLPMPYLVATLLGPEQSDGDRVAAPFTTNDVVNDELMHYVDTPMLLKDAIPLGQLAADGHRIEAQGLALTPKVEKVLVYDSMNQPPFSTLDEAVKSFENIQHRFDSAPFVGDTVVDVLMRYRPGFNPDRYALSSTLDPGLPGQEETANLILDYSNGEPLVYRETGLLDQAIQIDRSAWRAAKTFVRDGIDHILVGIDHVLFVICLVLGAVSLRSLVWRVTGFTIGHSVTLSLGFFGFTPSGDWFVPLVETGIALSIIFAAILALSRSADTGKDGLASFAVTCMVGMLHGLGFSFVVKEILGITSSNIWISLLSFNVGVEIGQMLIVLLVWPVLWLVGKHYRHYIGAIRWAIAIPCIAMASIWSGQRATAYVSTLL